MKRVLVLAVPLSVALAGCGDGSQPPGEARATYVPGLGEVDLGPGDKVAAVEWRPFVHRRGHGRRG